MFKPLLSKVANHLLAQNRWASRQLQAFGGRTVCLRLLPASVTLTLLEDGGLVPSGETATADATITLTPSLALRILAGDEAAAKEVTLSGDTELAMAVAQCLQQIRWDYEEDLSRVVGDVAATKIAGAAQHTIHTMQGQIRNLAEMASEYWQEEQPLIAKKFRVEAFGQQVDQFRDDLSRLDKQFDRAEQRLNALLNAISPTSTLS